MILIVALMEPDKAANGKTVSLTVLCELCMYVEMRVLTVAV